MLLYLFGIQTDIIICLYYTILVTIALPIPTIKFSILDNDPFSAYNSCIRTLLLTISMIAIICLIRRNYHMSYQFISGLIFLLALVIGADTVLPISLADENGIIENIQVLTLILATLICLSKTRRSEGSVRLLWWAGFLFCALLVGRELSWGRVFFPPMENGNFPPIKALPYGPLVYPLIGVTMLSIIVLLVRGKIVHYFRTHDMSLSLHTLLAAAILIAADAEKLHLLAHTQGMLVEELCELYAYAIFAYILYKMKTS